MPHDRANILTLLAEHGNLAPSEDVYALACKMYDTGDDVSYYSTLTVEELRLAKIAGLLA